MEKENREAEFFWAYAVERERKEHPFNREWKENKKQRTTERISEDLEFFND